MMNFTRPETRIFLSVTLVTLVFVALFILRFGLYIPAQGVNSDGYWPLAERLYEHHDFFRTTPPFFPELSHLPGYPTFLAIFGVPFGSVVPALLIQALLMGLSAVFLYRLTEGVFSERVRLFSALLFGIEPFTAFTAASPLSEALCLFFLISSLLMARRAWEQRTLTRWAYAGLLFGLGIMVRPILMYATPLIVIFAGWVLLRRSLRSSVLGMVVFVLGVSVLPGMWMVRNHGHFDTWILSNKGPFTLYVYDVTELVAQRDGVSTREANETLLALAREKFPELTATDDLFHPRYAGYLTEASAEIIAQNIPLYIKIHSASLATFLFSDGYRLLLRESGISTQPLPNITRSLLAGDMRGVSKALLEAPQSLALLIAGLLFWSSVFFLACVGVVQTLWKRDEMKKVFVVLFFVAFIGYFAMLTGPVAQARYRIMITPFLFPLAIYGASVIRSMYRSRVSRASL